MIYFNHLMNFCSIIQPLNKTTRSYTEKSDTRPSPLECKSTTKATHRSRKWCDDIECFTYLPCPNSCLLFNEIGVRFYDMYLKSSYGQFIILSCI